MKNAILLFSLSVLSISCFHTSEKPKNLVEKSQMVSTLVEIYLHQQTSYMNELPSAEWNPTENDAYLINQQGLEIEQFKESYRYYVLRPEEFTEILQGIRSELENKLPEEARLKRLETQRELENPKQ